MSVSKKSLVRRQVRAALNAIDDLIPVPWDLQLLVGRIADRRGRPIRLLPTEFPAVDVSGLWLPTRDADLIYYDRSASPAVMEQTVGHELGHLLMNHDLEARGSGTAVAGQLAAVEIDPALIERFLARTAYGTANEAAAEEFGTRLLQTGHRRRGSPGADALGRLTGSLR
jgi:hypothetical protein